MSEYLPKETWSKDTTTLSSLLIDEKINELIDNFNKVANTLGVTPDNTSSTQFSRRLSELSNDSLAITNQVLILPDDLVITSLGMIEFTCDAIVSAFTVQSGSNNYIVETVKIGDNISDYLQIGKNAIYFEKSDNTFKLFNANLYAGLPGDVGPKGPIGNMGPKGLEGQPGDTGPVGDVGPKGYTGATGADGATGSEGVVGDIGPKGLKGYDGPSGPKGPDGPKGPVGYDGFSIDREEQPFYLKGLTDGYGYEGYYVNSSSTVVANQSVLVTSDDSVTSELDINISMYGICRKALQLSNVAINSLVLENHTGYYFYLYSPIDKINYTIERNNRQSVVLYNHDYVSNDTSLTVSNLVGARNQEYVINKNRMVALTNVVNYARNTFTEER